MSSSSERQRNKKIIDAFRQTLAKNQQRREKFRVGEKFNFVEEKLQNILHTLENTLDYHEEEKVDLPPWHRELEENERVVYIYLYNAQGKDAKVWQRLLSRKSMQDYSFSRPIYTKREYVEAILSQKDHTANHAFIAVVVKKNHIIESDIKDNMGNPRIRLLEGSLDADNIIEFVHRKRAYYRDSRARLLLKSSDVDSKAK